jgi:hypothetical protein
VSEWPEDTEWNPHRPFTLVDLFNNLTAQERPMPHVHQFLYPQPNLPPYPFSDACECGVMRDYAANHHPYRVIWHEERPTKIDEGMLEVLADLWDAGVKTAHCCQGGCPVNGLDGRQTQGYLSFATADRATVETVLDHRFEILDIQPEATLREPGDKLATAIYFTPEAACEMCAQAAASWEI